jgi:hypothetical protein
MPYFQEFFLDRCSWTEQTITSGGRVLKGGVDLIFLSDPDSIDGSFEVIFAGFGIEDSMYSNYEGLDVKGKVVLAFSGEPEREDGNYILSGSRQPSRKGYYYSKAQTARKKGAVGLIIMAREEKDFKKYSKDYIGMITRPVTFYRSDGISEDIFSVYVPAATGAAICQTGVDIFLEMTKDERLIGANSGKFTGIIGIKANSLCFPVRTENVIGIVEGTDKKDEAVVVIAHYDHHGIRDGKLYPGADDNASGTAAVMELAEAFAQSAKAGNPPRRTVIFIAVSAEEIGLYGSRYYSENPVMPLDKTAACVNIDMIGRVGSKYKDDPMFVGGFAYVSEDILHIAQQNNALMAPGLKDQMEYSKNVRGGSDHYYFAAAGIPSLFYFTGIHKDYHEPSDTPDKILYGRMEQTVRAIFGTTWHLANSDEELKIED